MTPHGGTRTQQEGDQEDEGVILLRRLDALERLVFGRSHSAAGAEAAPVREVEPLARKIEAVSKTVSRAEGGGRDLQDLALKASHLGLLSLAPSTASTQHVALKENIVYTARGEVEITARLLSQVKTLQEHINPPYLRDMPQLTRRLNRLEDAHIRQATESARVSDRAENARLHYSEAMNLVSEKFVLRDDQVARLERNHLS
eukprot:g6340.t1